MSVSRHTTAHPANRLTALYAALALAGAIGVTLAHVAVVQRNDIDIIVGPDWGLSRDAFGAWLGGYERLAGATCVTWFGTQAVALLVSSPRSNAAAAMHA